jgi:uncharacterized coiled-coil protein SlyX
MSAAGDREGLIARIRQIRRLAAVREEHASEADLPQAERVQSLETRVAHLEQMVEGLQDSVHREAGRHDRLIAEIQAQIQPAAMRAALADDARQRGL